MYKRQAQNLGNTVSEVSDLIAGDTTWLKFGVLVAILILIYLAIQLIIFILENLSRQSSASSRIVNALYFILEHVEPIVVLIVVAYFLSINLVLHSIIMILLVVGGYRQIRDYITGKALLYGGSLRQGTRLTVGDLTGEVGEINRFGFQLKVQEVIHFINFAKLYDQDFAVQAQDAYRGFYAMDITSSKGEMNLSELTSLIFNSPFTDNHSEIKPIDYNPESRKVRLSIHLRNATHLDDLKAYLEQKGYKCY